MKKTDIKIKPTSWIQGARSCEMPEWIRTNPKAFRFLYELAERSRREEANVEYTGKLIHLNVREFVTGRKSTSQKIGISEQEYRTLYKRFEKLEYIKTIKATKHFTIGKYLADSIFFNNYPASKPSVTPSLQPTNNQQLTTNNNEKNEKNNTVSVKQHKNYSSFSDLKYEDLKEISETYKISIGFVLLQNEKLKNYCESSGRRYKNYKSALKNFVIRDLQRTTERRSNDSKQGIDARYL